MTLTVSLRPHRDKVCLQCQRMAENQESVQMTCGFQLVNKDNIPTIWIWLPYIGNKGKHLRKQYIRKVKHNCTNDIKFLILCNTKKISQYCTVKDKIPIAQRSSVTYQLTCPCCVKRYFGKTDRCFHIRIDEHGRKPDQLIHRYLKNCSYFQVQVNFILYHVIVKLLISTSRNI